MHEHSIAQDIISKAKTYGAVKSITVSVGDLAHLPAKEMKEVLAKRTSWGINVVSVPAKVVCVCGFEGAPKIIQQMHDGNVFECDKCGVMFPKILEGGDIVLQEVEVEE